MKKWGHKLWWKTSVNCHSCLQTIMAKVHVHAYLKTLLFVRFRFFFLLVISKISKLDVIQYILKSVHNQSMTHRDILKRLSLVFSGDTFCPKNMTFVYRVRPTGWCHWVFARCSQEENMLLDFDCTIPLCYGGDIIFCDSYYCMENKTAEK